MFIKTDVVNYFINVFWHIIYCMYAQEVYMALKPQLYSTMVAIVVVHILSTICNGARRM